MGAGHANYTSHTHMMTSSNGNIFRVTGHLCGEFTGHRWIPRTNGQWRGALMFSLICAWINCWVNNRNIWDVIAPIMTSQQWVYPIVPHIYNISHEICIWFVVFCFVVVILSVSSGFVHSPISFKVASLALGEIIRCWGNHAIAQSCDYPTAIEVTQNDMVWRISRTGIWPQHNYTRISTNREYIPWNVYCVLEAANWNHFCTSSQFVW